MKCNGKKITAVIMSLAMGAAFMTAAPGQEIQLHKKQETESPSLPCGPVDRIMSVYSLKSRFETFNASQDKYEAKLEFITSGTGAEGLFDRVVAAKRRVRRKQTLM